MARGRKKKEILGSEFMDAVQAMSTEELKEKIIVLAKNEREILDTKDEDAKLQEAIELLADLNGGYRDALKYNKEQRRYVLKILESRGQ